LERQGGFYWLEVPPLTIPGKDHRPAYGSDGDYFSKPNRELIIGRIYHLMREVEPSRFPPLYDEP